MTASQGFWSYVHKDDQADAGRLTHLANDIVQEYEMLTNDSIELFLDRDDIEWGHEWKRRIDGSLAGVAFFVSVLTPRYFASPVCRSELNTFARRASELGVERLLLPILYTNVPGLEDDTDDELMKLVSRFQWVDWRELRFADRSSSAYRLAVSKLAQRLADANLAAETSEVSEAVIARAEKLDDDAGVLDLLANFEQALPDLTATTQEISAEILTINTVVLETQREMQASQAPTFAQRLLLLRKLALGLAGPSDRLSSLGDAFAKQLHDVDLGVRAIIERAPLEPESREEFQQFFASIRGMVSSAEQGMDGMEHMINAAAPLEKLSRDVRAPIRDMRHGITAMTDARGVMQHWLTLMSKSGVDDEPTNA